MAPAILARYRTLLAEQPAFRRFWSGSAAAVTADEIVRIKGADWKLEMGTLAEIVNHARTEPPAILFDRCAR